MLMFRSTHRQVRDMYADTTASLSKQLNQALSSLEIHKREYSRVVSKLNGLIEQINAKGGADFLEYGVLNPVNQFTKEEIDRLIRLCHPDRHEGVRQQSATEMTQKLLQIKENLK